MPRLSGLALGAPLRTKNLMKPRWRKVIHDLLDNKARTLLVVLSIAVGVFSIGVIAGAYQIISNDMSASYSANNPANIELRMSNFDEDVLQMIHNQRGVEDAEGRRVFNVRVRVPGTEKWTTLDMIAFEDFEKNAINLLKPIEGQTMPKKREVMLEQDALQHIDTGVGQQLEFQLPDGSTKTLPVVGVVQDTAAGAGDFLASPYGYITMDTLQYLGQPKLFNRALVIVSERGDDIFHIRDRGAKLKDKLEKNDNTVIRMRFSETHKHPLADTVNAILGILMALGHLDRVPVEFVDCQYSECLAQSALAVHRCDQARWWAKATSLLHVSHAHHGIWYSGADDRHSLGWTRRLWTGVIHLRRAEFQSPGLSHCANGSDCADAVGLLVPLIAGLVPVINGSRITVLRALSGGLAEDVTQAKGGEERLPWFDWMQVKATRILAKRGIHIPRPFVISLRNTFRRKSRLALTLFTLTMGGAIFIAVFNVRVTLHDYIGQIGNYFVADVSLDFDKPYRLTEIQQKVSEMDGVQHVEGWQFVSGELLDEKGEVLENINIFGPPANSQLIEPILVAGRWIQADDVRKMAVSEGVYKYFPDIKPGDTVSLKIDGRDEIWEVVGIFQFVDREGVLAYAPYEYVSKMNHLVNRAYSFRLVTDRHNRPYQDAKAEELDKYFRDIGFKVRIARGGTRLAGYRGREPGHTGRVPADHGDPDCHCRFDGTDRHDGHERAGAHA